MLLKRKNGNSRSLLAYNRLQAKTSEVLASCYFQGSITDLCVVANLRVLGGEMIGY